MKKFILLLALFFGMSGFAQENKSRNSEGSTEEMATVQATRLALQLDLTEEQQNKLTKLFIKQIEERRKLMQEGKQTGEKPAGLEEEISEKYKAGLKDILTLEQFSKWEQLQEKRQKGRSTPVKNN